MSRQNSGSGPLQPPPLAIAPTIQLSIAAPPESGIRLDYPGKLSVRSILGKLRPRCQRRLPQFCEGTEEEQTQNLLIEGDNLQVMASLYRYRGQVDFILADPPYNTGNDFRYNDRWEVDPNDPDPGQIVSEEDGGKHTKWMRFMAPRLEMMKAMLRPGGVLAICIDERELFRLGMMMDEIFYESNRIAIINWQKSYSAKNDSGHVSTSTEYVLVYAKSRDKAETGLLERTAEMDAYYRHWDKDPEPWAFSDLSAKPHKKPEDYGIQSPFTGEIQYPSGDRGRWGKKKSDIKAGLEQWGSEYVELEDPKATFPSLVLKGTYFFGDKLTTPPGVLAEARQRAIRVRDNEVWPQIVFRHNGEGFVRSKRYLKDVKKGRVLMTYWADEDYETPLVIGNQSWDYGESGHSQAGVKELSAIVGKGHNFQTVKPLKLIRKLIHIWCPPKGIVLDPFAGSGTTGHAVLSLNRDVGTARRFILIEQSRPEKGDAYAKTLTAERLKRVISGKWYAGEQEPLPGGFTFKTSTTQVDRIAVLAMQREEMVDLVLMSHWEINTRRGPLLRTLVHKGYKYLVAKDGSGNGYFLVWTGPNERTPLTVDSLGEIAEEAKAEGLNPPYHVYARTSHVMAPNVIFYQIPDEILNKIGFNDAFGVGDEQ